MVNLGLIEVAIEEFVLLIVFGAFGAVIWLYFIVPILNIPCGIFSLTCGAGTYFFAIIWGTTGMLVGGFFLTSGNDNDYK